MLVKISYTVRKIFAIAIPIKNKQSYRLNRYFLTLSANIKLYLISLGRWIILLGYLNSHSLKIYFTLIMFMLSQWTCYPFLHSLVLQRYHFKIRDYRKTFNNLTWSSLVKLITRINRLIICDVSWIDWLYRKEFIIAKQTDINLKLAFKWQNCFLISSVIPNKSLTGVIEVKKIFSLNPLNRSLIFHIEK